MHLLETPAAVIVKRPMCGILEGMMAKVRQDSVRPDGMNPVSRNIFETLATSKSFIF